MSIDIKDFQISLDILQQALKQFDDNGEVVTVGIHEDAGMVKDGEITQAQLGAIQHFGATINHPGGTSYGYRNKKDVNLGKVRFLKKGQGAVSLGVTKPHVIKIPARPWLDVGVESGDYHNLEADNLHGLLNEIGVLAESATKEYINDLQSPPNAPSTIRKKGFNNPLIQSGEMRNSVTYVVGKRGND